MSISRSRRNRLQWLLLLVAALPAPGRAEVVTLPDTPPARRLSEILEHINTGDRTALETYATAHFSAGMMKPDPSSILEFLHAQYTVNGGYDVRSVVQSSADQITVLVEGRREPRRWRRLVVGTEPEPPHRVAGIFMFEASAALANLDDSPVPPAELPDSLARIVGRIAAEGGFSGSVCLARGDSTVLSRAWGEANRETHVANRPDTRFTIASVGKTFTAVAVARLVEAGKVRFDDPIARHVPDWVAPQSRAITVAQLLEHTSGLGDFLDRVAGTGRRYDRLSDYRAIAAADTPAFAPGSQFRYSNVGYLMLGALVERVSGEPWDRHLTTHVFGPARMHATSAYRPRSGKDPVATGYVARADGGWARADSLIGGRGTSAGGSVSTAADLVAFARALRTGALISPAMRDTLTTPRVEMAGTGMLYGRGFTVSRGDPGRRVWGHSGGTFGVGALLEVYENGDWSLAVLSNTTDGARIVADAWRDLLRRGSPDGGARRGDSR